MRYCKYNLSRYDLRKYYLRDGHICETGRASYAAEAVEAPGRNEVDVGAVAQQVNGQHLPVARRVAGNAI